MLLRRRKSQVEPMYAPKAVLLIGENLNPLVEAYIGYRREMDSQHSFLAALQNVLADDDFQVVMSFREGNSDPVYGEGNGRRQIDEELPAFFEKQRQKYDEVLAPISPSCIICGDAVYDDEGWQRSRCIADIKVSVPLIEEVVKTLKDPNLDFGFKTMDPEPLAEMAADFDQLADSLHDSVHNPAERTVALDEVEAKASASVAMGMIYVTLDPDSYFRYWRTIIDQGLPVPEAVQEQLSN